ncbi:Multiple EGF-like-domain protein 3 precursor [Minicystis rosea]|nr:Multiple EGF-like-domain protein 3 precursor [Minicystis rosea]
MLRRAWCVWSVVAVGVLVGCGGGGSSGTGGSGGGTTSSSSSTGGAMPSCGDGTVGEAEACDDGNVVDGDGCAKDCTIERGYTCSGAPSTCATTCGDGVIAGAETCDDSNTTAGDGCSASCETEQGFACTGEPSVCTPGCGDGLVVGSETCDDNNMTDGDGCSATCAPEDGWSCDGAPSICAPVFGDGKIVGSEECDDGNTTDGDGCSATSTKEPGWSCDGAPSVCVTTCGDGIKAGTETCDDGNATDGDGCSGTACTIEDGWLCDGAPSICTTTCGDGIKAGTEACDDGNTTAGDGCDAACATIETGYTCAGSPSVCATTCGDGIKAGTEVCDDGNTKAGDGCDAACATIEEGWYCTGSPSVCTTQCGDGKTAGAELCDDGNTNANDGCDASCLVETGWACAGTPSTCATVCGDSKLAGTETCDDGNVQSGDGCSSACALEPGWTCTGTGAGSCVSVCGDGLLVGAEKCDDGATAAGDGCSATCQVETGFACSGAPSVCNPVCGDGIKVTGEKCDDGNLTSGDGCSSTCQIEPGFELEKNNTMATANDFQTLAIDGKINGFIQPAADIDYYFFVVPTGQTGVITAETITNFQGHVCDTTSASTSKLTVYDSAGTSLKSDTTSGVGSCSLVTSPALTPGTYYVAVQHSSTTGTLAYTLQVNVSLATCGDGITGGGEQCDDGNTTDGDGCSALCKLEPAPEVEPNNSCATATGAFALPPNKLMSGSIATAGDQDFYAITLTNYTDLRVETFDETGPGNCATGHDSEVQAYNASCTALGAADDDGSDFGLCSLLDPTNSSQTFMKHLAPGTYYILVKAHSSTATFNYTVMATAVAICGNGVKEGSEACDGGTFCASDCTLLPGCGNGLFEAGEGCDDGNNVDGDGCSATCTIETNFLCTTTSPSVCTHPCTGTQTLVQYSSTDIPKAIPDNTATGVSSTISVPVVGSVQNVFLQFSITHTFDGDIDLSLISPAGTTLDVTSDNGSTGDNYTNTILNDACTTSVTSGSAPFTGCFKPETAFSTLNGQAANGTWTLKVVDDANSDTGTLTAWALALCVQ